MSRYGKELILDLHDCEVSAFNHKDIESFMDDLCKAIGMTQCALHFWDDLDTPENEKQTSPHTVGTSAVQFILTSNVTIHTLNLLEAVYLNIFSCKDFDADAAVAVALDWFGGAIVTKVEIDRL